MREGLGCMGCVGLSRFHVCVGGKQPRYQAPFFDTAAFDTQAEEKKMKINKTALKAMLAECEKTENCVMQSVGPETLVSLIKEVLKARRLRKRLKPLRLACDQLREYVEGDDVNEDRLGKYEHPVQEAAITAILGDEFYTELNEKLK